MPQKKKAPTSLAYVAAIQFEHAAMINTLTFICEEAALHGLSEVIVHIKKAIAELKKNPLPLPEDGLENYPEPPNLSSATPE